LHRNIPRHFVTGLPNHSIYKAIKELAKASRREKRPSSGKNIAARRAEAGASSGLFAFQGFALLFIGRAAGRSCLAAASQQPQLHFSWPRFFLLVARPDGKPQLHFSWPRFFLLVARPDGKPQLHFCWPRS
jgi:hypothetical protein